MKKLLFLLGLLLGSVYGFAQYTNVTGQVYDASGANYTNAHVAIAFVPGGTCAGPIQFVTGGNIPFTQTTTTLDATGNLSSLRLPDNAQLTCAGTWNFNICSTTNVCFTSAIYITGATDNIGATLRAAAPLLNGTVSVSGAVTTNNCVKFAGPKTIADAGGTCGSGSGSVTNPSNLATDKIVLGGANGTTDVKTDSAATSDGAGALSGLASVTTAAGGFVGSADTGSPKWTFGSYYAAIPYFVKVTAN